MLHLRVIVPPGRAGTVVPLLREHPGVTNIAVLPGAALEPPGDLLLADVAREAATPVIGLLREQGCEQEGSIAIDEVDVSISRAADQAEAGAPGLGVDAVVWEEVEARTSEESTLSVTYLTFMAIATVLAAIGVLLDSPILVIGAMVVGPEFGAVAGVSVGLVARRRAAALRSLVALVVGFAVAFAVTVVAVKLLDFAGLVTEQMLTAHRPLTSFISQPNALSFVVAFLAGIVGTLSLTAAKSGALVGVLISVTTVPAAGDAAASLAYGRPVEATGSAAQLGLNLLGLLAAGVLTLTLQRRGWARWGRPGTQPSAARTSSARR